MTEKFKKLFDRYIELRKEATVLKADLIQKGTELDKLDIVDNEEYKILTRKYSKLEIQIATYRTRIKNQFWKDLEID